MQQEARRQRENSNDKVSQAINLGSSYILRDRPEDALKSLEGIDWARSLSGYGRMQLQHVRLRAYLQLGNRAEAEKVFVYLRENKLDAPDTWQEAMLDWGDVDGAAAHYIARLRDPEQREAGAVRRAVIQATAAIAAGRRGCCPLAGVAEPPGRGRRDQRGGPARAVRDLRPLALKINPASRRNPS